MALVLLVCNQRTIMWLNEPGTAGDMLPVIRAGRWGVPEPVRRRLDVPPGTAFRALSTGRVVVVTPEHSPIEKAERELTPEQVRLLTLLQRGLPDKQAALQMGRSTRWVRYQLAELRKR
jgi:hypothetical protein